MKSKFKIVTIVSASLMLLGLMQVSIASTEAESAAFELTDAHMDVITAGAKAKARARGARTAATRAVTNANRRTNRGVAIGIATGRHSSARARTAATGDVVRTRGARRNGRYHAVEWSVTYGFNRR